MLMFGQSTQLNDGGQLAEMLNLRGISAKLKQPLAFLSESWYYINNNGQALVAWVSPY